MGQDTAFDGAKMALFLGRKLAVILRDDLPGLPYAGYWDLPGGGREGDETALACVRRECQEELGLDVPPRAFHWRERFVDELGVKWFFVAQCPAELAAQIVFGNEGQRWSLMTPQAFLSHPKAVPAFQARLAEYLKENPARQTP